MSVSGNFSDDFDVAVVIPVFNVEEFIAAAIESVLYQDPPFKQIIIVDDGSIDGTAKVIAGFQNARILYHHQKNKGLGPARNVGITLSSSKFIYFMDGDDVLVEGMTATIRKELLSSEEMPDAILFSAIDFAHNSGKTLATSAYFRRSAPGYFERGEDALVAALRSGSFPVCAFLYVFARSALEAPPQPLRFLNILHEDEVFTPALLLKCKGTVVLDQILYRRRVRKNSIMTSPVATKNVVGYLTTAQWWLAQTKPGLHSRSKSKEFLYQGGIAHAKAMLMAGRASVSFRTVRGAVKELTPRFYLLSVLAYFLNYFSRKLTFALLELCARTLKFLT